MWYNKKIQFSPFFLYLRNKILFRAKLQDSELTGITHPVGFDSLASVKNLLFYMVNFRVTLEKYNSNLNYVLTCFNAGANFRPSLK